MGMNKGDVRFSNPCSVDWRTMTPADGGRFCGDCKKVVRDLSKLTEVEARTVLAKSRNEDLCVRFAFDAHGKILFKDMQGVGLLPPSLLSRAKRAAVAAAAIAAPLATQACSVTSSLTGHSESADTSDHDSDDPSSDNTSTGGVAYDPSYDQTSADASADGDTDAQPSADASADAGPDAPAHN
jgi:hypothetical protein